MESTLCESFILPSRGLVYDTSVNPAITLRSMTTWEEMKRQSPSDTPYKVMSDIIEDCMSENPGIHVYDMCLGDYQYLLHKLRIITYGKEYKMLITCPNCGAQTTSIADLDTLTVNEYDSSYADAKRITLPVTEKVIELNYQTPRSLDTIAYKKKELQRKQKSAIDYDLLFTLTTVVNTIDGVKYDSIDLEEWAKKLPMKDVNYILNKSTELTGKVGLDAKIIAKCSKCGYECVVPFRYTSEFLRPTD